MTLRSAQASKAKRKAQSMSAAAQVATARCRRGPWLVSRLRCKYDMSMAGNVTHSQRSGWMCGVWGSAATCAPLAGCANKISYKLR